MALKVCVAEFVKVVDVLIKSVNIIRAHTKSVSFIIMPDLIVKSIETISVGETRAGPRSTIYDNILNAARL